MDKNKPDTKADKGESRRVKVVVRVRPLHEEDDNLWVQVVNRKTLQTINHRNTQEVLEYEFTSVYSADTNQKTVYEDNVKPFISNTMKGQNASVFAYGPTGAGKTHTILGTAEDPGIIPRCIKDVFISVSTLKQELQDKGEMWTISVAYSYLEIYNEKVLDLLNPTQTDLPIREDHHKKIFVAGLSEKEIENVQEFNESFGPASKNRTTAATKLNERSSRSHSILLLKVTRTQKEPPHRKLTGKLYIIDLAGSEDNRRTGNQGVRLKESGAINSSLLALGQVVEALNKTKVCIPYRASKLTRLLQDSLGGSALTCMIVNLSPEEKHYFDTYTTLHFARKTKKIVNNVKVNESFEKPKAKTGFKRAHPSEEPDSTSDAVKAEEPAHTPPKKQAPVPAPFLSPLLRHQSDLRHEMLNRLEELEERLLHQMAQPATSSSARQGPDTTTDVNQVTSSSALSAKDPNNFHPALQELQKMKDKFGGKEKAQVKGKIYADGSSKENCHLKTAPVTSSPLFLKPAILKKRKFKSTACSSDTDSSRMPTQLGDAEDDMLHTNAQRKHNDRILMILNTGTSKELQDLQTVGPKRADLIHSWRQLQGHFTSFDDLRKVNGLGAKYINTFLKNNLINL